MAEKKSRYTDEQIKAMKARHFAQARPDEEIDTSDIPTPTPEQWAKARLVTPPAKKPISIRLDEDVLDWFKAQDGPYQTRINGVLRLYMEAQASQ